MKIGCVKEIKDQEYRVGLTPSCVQAYVPVSYTHLENGMKGGVEAMKCLSDKYFYQEMLGIPTINFGPGEIRHAHSGSEQVRFSQVAACANSIHDFLGKRAQKGQG